MHMAQIMKEHHVLVYCVRWVVIKKVGPLLKKYDIGLSITRYLVELFISQ